MSDSDAVGMLRDATPRRRRHRLLGAVALIVVLAYVGSWLERWWMHPLSGARHPHPTPTEERAR